MIKLYSKVGRVEELVGSGSPDVSYMDNEKRSPLHAAAFVGNSDIVEILISKVGRALVLVDYYHFGAMFIMMFFVQGGARVNTKDNQWLTPLHR